jgi:hypothetical protein
MRFCASVAGVGWAGPPGAARKHATPRPGCRGKDAGLGKHPIEALSVQMGVARQNPNATVGVGNIPQGQKKDTLVLVLQASVKVLRRRPDT